MYKPPNQLPTQFGTDVYPEVMQAPPRFETRIDASQEWFDRNISPDQAVAQAGDYYSSSINQFVGNQRQQYGLGGLQQRRTQMTMPGLQVDYQANTGAETIRMTVRPESLPSEAFVSGPDDYIMSGYIVLRSHNMSTPAVPASTSTVRLPGFWLGGQLLLDLSHPSEQWAPSVIDFAAYTALGGGAPLQIRSVGGLVRGSVGVTLDEMLLNIVINAADGTTNVEMQFIAGPVDAGPLTLGPVVAGPGFPAAPEHKIVSTIKLNGRPLADVMSPFFDRARLPSGLIPIVVVRFGSEALHQHSVADHHNPNKLLNVIKPPREDGLLPAYFPFAIPTAADVTDPFWDLDFWASLNWSKSYWLRDQWLALGLNIEELTPNTPPAPNTITYIDLPISALSRDGKNVLTVGSNQAPSGGAVWDVHAEFYSRSALRRVVQGPHLSGRVINTNDMPRYWAGTIGDSGSDDVRTMLVDLTVNVSDDEIVLPPDIAVPAAATMP